MGNHHATLAFEQSNTKITDNYKTICYDFANNDWNSELEKINKCFDDLSKNTLYTDRLIIQKTCETDIPKLARLLMDPDVIRYLNVKEHAPFKTIDEAINHLKITPMYQFIQFTVKLKDNPTVIGNITFSVLPKRKQVQLGYFLGKEYQGHSYAFESVSALAKKLQTPSILDVLQSILTLKISLPKS